MEAGTAATTPERANRHRRGRGPLRIALVGLLVLLAGLGATAWWGTGCHDSSARTPARWGSGPVPGTLRVTDDGRHAIGAVADAADTAMFTADQGGSVTFRGGTNHYFDDLECAVR